MDMNFKNYTAIVSTPCTYDEHEAYHNKLWNIYNYLINDKIVSDYINNKDIIIKPIYLVKRFSEDEKYRVMRDIKILTNGDLDRDDIKNIKETIRIAIMRCNAQNPGVISYTPNIIGTHDPIKPMPFIRAYMNRNGYFGDFKIRYNDNGRVVVKKETVNLPKAENHYKQLLRSWFDYGKGTDIHVKYDYHFHSLDFFIITKDFDLSLKSLNDFMEKYKDDSVINVFSHFEKYNVNGDVISSTEKNDELGNSYTLDKTKTLKRN